MGRRTSAPPLRRCVGRVGRRPRPPAPGSPRGARPALQPAPFAAAARRRRRTGTSDTVCERGRQRGAAGCVWRRPPVGPIFHCPASLSRRSSCRPPAHPGLARGPLCVARQHLPAPPSTSQHLPAPPSTSAPQHGPATQHLSTPPLPFENQSGASPPPQGRGTARPPAAAPAAFRGGRGDGRGRPTSRGPASVPWTVAAALAGRRGALGCPLPGLRSRGARVVGPPCPLW